MRRSVLLVTFFVVLGLVACGAQSQPAGGNGENPTADSAKGEVLFSQTLIGTQAGCITCHSLEPDVTLVGPSMAGLGVTAGARDSSLSAEEYLRASIVAPNDLVIEGFAANLMPTTYGTELTEQEINDLVAYLLTLK